MCVLAGMLAAALPQGAGAAEFPVDSTADGMDANAGDKACLTEAGTCTLRAAVQEANASSGSDVIVLPAGRFTLTRPNISPLPQQTADNELDPANGDLDVSGDLDVRGAGADRTRIDGGHLDRVFSVMLGATARFRALTITHGDPTVNNKLDNDISLGGAILNNGTTRLTAVALIHNHADGGGGLFTVPESTLTVRRSLVANNSAVEGGGLRVDSGARIVNTTIQGNRLEYRDADLPDEVTGYGGGIDHRGGDDLIIINSTITGNHAYKAGGGLNSGQDYAPVVPAELWPYRVYVRNSIIAGNTADAGTADCHVANMVIQSEGSNLASDDSCFLTAPGDLASRPPMLGPLAFNGGPTKTRAPRRRSPAIDAGAAEGCPPRDQRRVRRPKGQACDIGAVEDRRRGHP